MHDLIVIASASQEQGMLQTYREQLKAADIEFVLEPLASVPYNVGCLKMKIDGIRRFIDKFKDRTYVFSDAWDVRFYGTKEEVLKNVGDDVILAAERNCWPDAHMANLFPDTGTPWKYVNGGLSIGTAEAFSQWTDEVVKHPFYYPEMIDQQWLNFMRIKHSTLTLLDSQTKLFYCMVHEAGELEFRNGRPYNTLCGTFPNWLHANGKYPLAPILMMEEASLMYGRVLAAIEEEKCQQA